MFILFFIEALKSNLQSYETNLQALNPETQGKEIADLETKIKLAKNDKQNFILIFRDLCSSRLNQIYNITSIFVLIHKVFYQNNYIHSLCFGDLIYEAKGVLVMLKIISESLIFYEDGKTFSGKFQLTERQ